MSSKSLFADVMREATASAGYRKVQSEMRKLVRTFSTKRYVYVSNPSEQTLEMLRNEGFTVERTKIVEYQQYKVSW